MAGETDHGWHKMNMPSDIDEYGKFTEDIWFSKHQLDCRARQEETNCTCDQDPERSLTIMTLGLAGECGEVMELLKKRIRDGKFDREALKKELGDVAYYWARLCMYFRMLPSEVLFTNQAKLLDRKARGTMTGSGNNR